MQFHAGWRLLTIALIAACTSDPSTTCGAGSASPTIDLVAGATTLSYGDLLASIANDCSDSSSGVISLTIQSTQVAGSGVFALCIVRPDRLESGLSLGTDVKVLDTSGAAGGCTFVRDPTTQPTGTARSTGECDNGSAAAGFALALDGIVILTRTCGGAMDTVSAALSGTVAVEPLDSSPRQEAGAPSRR